MTKKNIEEEILGEYWDKKERNNWGFHDNFISKTFEEWLEETLFYHRKAILDDILKFVKERKQTLDVGFRVPGEKYKGLYDWEDLINYLTKLKDEDY